MKESDSLEEPAREPQAEPVSTISLDELKEAIAVKGRERGFVTSEDLLEGLPVEDLAPEQVEDFLTQVEEHLRTEGIDIIEVPGEELDGETETTSFRLPGTTSS
jgi:hypothetical protein